MTQETPEEATDTTSDKQTGDQSDETGGQREAESPTGRISLRLSFDIDWGSRSASSGIRRGRWREVARYIKKPVEVFKDVLPCAHKVCETVYYLVMITGNLAMLFGIRAVMEGPPM
ncbi:hypothetical protein C475_11253 [Halosimplex carlsbadense 2-9-1]|uniref:Uncharacterized protein n=1 Tax=Halosimplex carlsbadense 2-9-1 TaxID=797114 RepID=M0CT35_9EURY|nr:hypothetical protein [Halosimplex carlsbadense]ELZ25009.1 hypothetical protein C475_11253 [Halosimplex carlsbadense 2-9-1]